VSRQVPRYTSPQLSASHKIILHAWLMVMVALVMVMVIVMVWFASAPGSCLSLSSPSKAHGRSSNAASAVGAK
jgi:hypothetical protein